MTMPKDTTLNRLRRALAARFAGMKIRGEPMLSSRLRHALFVLFLGGILAYGAGFAWYMLARFDLINLIRDASEDDAFYYFQIARNLAEGKFSTFDGGITRTNGYHPLWLLLITPFYWLFDKEAALFAIKAFEIMLVAGGVALVAAAARPAGMPWYLLFAALPMLYRRHALIAGMEAAAALFMLGLFFLAAMLYARDSQRRQWPLAAVAFALPWVRLEYIAISLAATAALGLIEWSRQERAPGASLGERARSALSVKAVVPFLAAAAGIPAYFAYNQLVFGGIVPVSGATKAAWAQIKWAREGGYSLAQNFWEVLQIPIFDYELLVALEVCAYLLLVWWFARRSRSRRDRLLLALLTGVFGLAAGHLAQFVQTVLTIHPSMGTWLWYFVPAYLMMALIVPVRCWVAIYLIRRFIGSKSQRATDILSLGIVLAGAAFLFAKTDFTEPFQWVAANSDSTQIAGDWTETNYGGTQLMNRVLPEDSVVGSWDAGVIGYFSRFPVVNLDGLVNSYDYFHATNVDRDGYANWDDEFIPLYRELGITHFANQPQKAANRPGFAAYRELGITHFANQPQKAANRPGFAAYRELGITHFANHTRMGFEGKVLFESSPSSTRRSVFYLWPIEPLEAAHTAAWIWKRMEPHFDYQSDGAGLLVDGRLAQAFARECDPDELVVWAGPGDETVVRAWTRTQTGLCVTAAILPHAISSPIRIETMSASDYAARLIGDSQPVVRSDFDVYLSENELIYVKEPCVPADTEATFFLALYPVDANDLPGRRKQHGFDNLDFDFGWRGVIFDGKCMATAALPEYAIARIGTGQYVSVEGGFHNFWEAEFRLDDGVALIVNAKESLEAALRSDYETLVSGEPVMRSDFDVYLSENTLTYVKEPCASADTEAKFFLALYPVDANDLPDRRKQHGFDNLDFDFDERGVIFDGKCMAKVALPEYAVTRIATGQYVTVSSYNNIWEAEFRLER